MGTKFLSPEVALAMLQTDKPLPKEIIDLKNAIEAETKVAELRASVNNEIDYAQVEKIVQMKLRLDGLYGQWAEGCL